MTIVARTFKVLACCLSILVLSACGGTAAKLTIDPVEVVFDTPMDEIVGGIRLAPPENHWDGYGQAVDMYGDVIVIGESEWNHSGSGSAYVYRLIDGEWVEEARLKASDWDNVRHAQAFGTSVTLGDEILAVGAPQALMTLKPERIVGQSTFLNMMVDPGWKRRNSCRTQRIRKMYKAI